MIKINHKIIKLKNDRRIVILNGIPSPFICSQKRGGIWEHYPLVGEALILPSLLLQVSLLNFLDLLGSITLKDVMSG